MTRKRSFILIMIWSACVLTLATAFDASFQLIDLPDLADPSQQTNAQEEKFKDIH